MHEDKHESGHNGGPDRRAEQSTTRSGVHRHRPPSATPSWGGFSSDESVRQMVRHQLGWSALQALGSGTSVPNRPAEPRGRLGLPLGDVGCTPGTESLADRVTKHVHIGRGRLGRGAANTDSPSGYPACSRTRSYHATRREWWRH